MPNCDENLVRYAAVFSAINSAAALPYATPHSRGVPETATSGSGRFMTRRYALPGRMRHRSVPHTTSGAALRLRHETRGRRVVCDARWALDAPVRERQRQSLPHRRGRDRAPGAAVTWLPRVLVRMA